MGLPMRFGKTRPWSSHRAAFNRSSFWRLRWNLRASTAREVNFTVGRLLFLLGGLKAPSASSEPAPKVFERLSQHRSTSSLITLPAADQCVWRAGTEPSNGPHWLLRATLVPEWGRGA